MPAMVRLVPRLAERFSLAAQSPRAKDTTPPAGASSCQLQSLNHFVAECEIAHEWGHTGARLIPPADRNVCPGFLRIV